jgi:hypothetical protein
MCDLFPSSNCIPKINKNPISCSSLAAHFKLNSRKRNNWNLMKPLSVLDFIEVEKLKKGIRLGNFYSIR